MTISSISQVTEEGYALSVAAFKRQGVVYLAWSTSGIGGRALLSWKPHSDAIFTEVQGAVLEAFRNISALWDPVDDALVVVYDNAQSDEGSDSTIYCTIFNPTTGALISGPTTIGKGMKPHLVYRNGFTGEVMELVYASQSRGSVYLRESRDGGASWGAEKPVLTNYVKGTKDVVAVPFDDEHLSIIQVGSSSRSVAELGNLSRTRPLVAIRKHPSIADRFYVVEASQRGTRLADNVRGALVGDGLYYLSGDRLGSDDGSGPLSLLNTSGSAPTIDTGIVAGSPIGDVMSLAQGVDVALGPTHMYVGGYGSGSLGTLYVIPIAGGTSGTPITGLAAVHAVAVGDGALFVATLEGAQERLRIYLENGLTPTLQASHKLPARVNALSVVMTSATQGVIYVSMSDRLNLYQVNGLDQPLRLFLTVPVLSRGSFHRVQLAQSGYLVCALGAGGVVVLDLDGGVKAMSSLSGVAADVWRRTKVYQIGDLATPTSGHVFAPQRKYFRCTTAGTSGTSEPSWCPATYGTVSDGTVVWQEMGPIDAVVTDVAVDQTRKRIYAVGVVGGNLGTVGRVYSLEGRGLV
jgi:hypothetical protein